MLRMRNRSAVGFVEPCLPSPAKRPPAGPNWLHEIKHDGFRILARRVGAGVRLFSRNGNDFTTRFPLAVAAVTALPAHSFLIDGEAIVCDESGLAVFELVRRARNGDAAVLCAFDLIELEGEDLRRAPIEHRKRKLSRLVRTPRTPASCSTSITTATAISCSSTPASSAAKVSCPSAWVRPTAQAASIIGSR
jgi:ATP-dependent DNA ligase